MNSETFHNLIRNYEKQHGEKPKTIHFGPADSLEFVKSIDNLIVDLKRTDDTKSDLLFYSKFPQDMTLYGIKVLFSQPTQTVLY